MKFFSLVLFCCFFSLSLDRKFRNNLIEMKHFKVSSFPSLSYTTLEAKKKKNHKKKKFTTTTKKNTVIISEINWVS